MALRCYIRQRKTLSGLSIERFHISTTTLPEHLFPFSISTRNIWDFYPGYYRPPFTGISLLGTMSRWPQSVLCRQLRRQLHCVIPRISSAPASSSPAALFNHRTSQLFPRTQEFSNISNSSLQVLRGNYDNLHTIRKRRTTWTHPALTYLTYHHHSIRSRASISTTTTTSTSRRTKRTMSSSNNDDAGDSSYMSFLDKANQDLSAGQKQQQQQTPFTSHTSTEVKTETLSAGTRIPDPLKSVEVYYVSETDEPFEPVVLKWDGARKGVWPSLGEFSISTFPIVRITMND